MDFLNRLTVYLYGDLAGLQRGGECLRNAVKRRDFLGSRAGVHLQIASNVLCRFGGGHIGWS